jgi:flagellar protein FlbD
MIKLTRLNRNPLIVNSDLIEHIEATPDTVLTLTSGQKFMVLESAEEVVEKVIAFRKLIFCRDFVTPLVPQAISHGR